MRSNSGSAAPQVEAIVVGAGFAGLYAVYKFRQEGISVQAYERGSEVGGTWFWNRYPGARCDIESILYSYGFSEELQQEWRWSSRYAEQSELLAYLEHVADKFDLRRDIQLNSTVEGARFDGDAGIWHVDVEGETVTGRHLVMATGCLSEPVVPKFEGLEDFEGDSFHTSSWPEDGVDLTGKRVGIIGTGSSSIQSSPLIAKEAEHLYVFQRTPQFAIPAWNRQFTDEEYEEIRADYADLRRRAWDTIGGVPFEQADHEAKAATDEQIDEWLQFTWQRGGYLMIASYPDVLFDEETNTIVGDWVKQRIRERVEDPGVAEKLMPTYPFAAKRLCVDTEYFEMYNRDNVTLVDVGETTIKRVSARGVETEAGEVELDVLVIATGFDAMTGALRAINPVGRGGVTLREKWENGAANYLGIMTSGFPNMYMINGPGSVSVLYNMVPAVEQHGDWIADAIAYLREHRFDIIEANADAEEEWTRHVDEVAATTVYPKAQSWYMGSNVTGKVEGFLAYAGGGPEYFKRMNDSVAVGYSGFTLSQADALVGKQ